MTYQFWIPFVVLFVSVTICERKWCLLRDSSTAKPQPYSWSKVQLAWWTVIVLSAIIAIMWKSHVAPILDSSSVILLGISSMTIATARMIDVSDKGDPSVTRHQDETSENFFLDILSDQNGISISRFQTVVFNLTFGVWMIAEVLRSLPAVTVVADPNLLPTVIPSISNNNLILLGLSSATYAAMKATENKEKKAEAKAAEELQPSAVIVEESIEMTEPAVG